MAMDKRLHALKEQFVQFGHSDVGQYLEANLSPAELHQYWHLIPIQELGPPLKLIPAAQFQFIEPHPYQTVGAPYGEGQSPWMIRQPLIIMLERAQAALHELRPEYRLLLLDGYRPKRVQEFMIQHEHARLVHERHPDPNALNDKEHAILLAEVLDFWAAPSERINEPTPHATGGAIDISIIDPDGLPLPMGGDFDEISERSLPSFYEGSALVSEQQYHRNRELLYQVMSQAGFRRLPHEWWHFSWGDQSWALKAWLDDEIEEPIALFGGC